MPAEHTPEPSACPICKSRGIWAGCSRCGRRSIEWFLKYVGPDTVVRVTRKGAKCSLALDFL